jgi:hypothetical protein
MGYVITEDHKTFSFHIGSQVNMMFDKIFHGIVEVQVDCDELSHVLDHFDNLPRRCDKMQKVVHYFGDNAKFIIANW